MKSALFFLGLLLAGCARNTITPAQQAANDKAEHEALVARIATVWSPKCEAMGFLPRTEPWTQCVMQLFTMEEQQSLAQTQQEAATRAYWGQALQNFGNTAFGPEATRATQIQVPATPAYTTPVAPAYPPTVYTTCQSNGTFIQGFSCTSQ
jgi:hypothetical protein